MKRSRPVAALVALAGSLLTSPARADFDRHCEERPLDAAERAAAERALSALRAALPDAPAGWTVTGNDERVSAYACEQIEGTTWKPGAKLVAEPVSVHVRRAYLRPASPAPAVAEAAPVRKQPAAASPADASRKKELEARLGELQRDRRDAQRQYAEARRTGDSAAQGTARARDKEISLAMRPIEEELSKLRDAEHQARAAETEARTAAAFAHARAVEESRRDGSITITANERWLQLRGRAEPFQAPGASAALRTSDETFLLLGPWRAGPDGAGATLEKDAPRTRVQTITVHLTGNRATTEALRAGVDLARLRPLVGR